MATATPVPAERVAPNYTLVLSEAEALYVYSALRHSQPVDEELLDAGDPVYEALSFALQQAGANKIGEYARRI